MKKALAKGLAALALCASTSGCSYIAEKFSLSGRDGKSGESGESYAAITTETLSDGSVVGTVSANSNESQLLAADANSAISGNSVVFPPGSLAIDTSVTLGEGTKASSDMIAQAGLASSDVAASSPATTVSTSGDQDPVIPLTLSINIPDGSALTTADINYIVFYSVYDFAKKQTYIGFYSGADLSLTGNFIKFQSAYFGTFEVFALNIPAPPPKTITIAKELPPTLTGKAFSLSAAEDTTFFADLPVTSTDGAEAKTCEISQLKMLTKISECVCTKGKCSISLRGTANFHGPASFSYLIRDGEIASDLQSVSVAITAVDDAPVSAAASITLTEDTETIIDLGYSDVDGVATACTLKSAVNITDTTPCNCTNGVCTVGVTGLADYFGTGSLSFVVTANGVESNTSIVALTINGVDDAPTVTDLAPSAASEDIETIVALTYSDIEADAATACSISALANLTVTTACACSAGACRVGVTGTQDFHGIGTFDYTVTAGGKTSLPATVTLPITSVIDYVTVSPLYTNAADWNDYYANDGPTHFSAGNVACTTSAIGYQTCLHGGEKKKVSLTAYTSCTDLTIADNLDAFDWICDDSGSHVVFYSAALKPHTRLAQLLDPTGWKTMNVEIEKDSLSIAESTLVAWWSRQVINLDALDGSTVGTSPNAVTGVTGLDNALGFTALHTYQLTNPAIYTLTTSKTLPGFNLNVDEAALVIFPGFKLTQTAGATLNCGALGDIGATYLCLVAAGDRRYQWIEGDLVGGNQTNQQGVLVGGSANYFSRVRHVRTEAIGARGVYANNAKNWRFEHIEAANGTGTGAEASHAHGGLLANIDSYNNSSYGIFINNTNDLRAFNLLLHSNASGLKTSRADRNIFAFATITNNGDAGYSGYYHNRYNSFLNVASVNNNGQGLIFSGTTDFLSESNQFSQIVSAHNGGYAVMFVNADNNTFTNNFLIGNNTSAGCSVDAASLGNSIAADQGCSAGAAMPNIVTSISLLSAYLGLATNDDTNLESSLTANLSEGAVIDWYGFDSRFRLWGKRGDDSLVNPLNRGVCTTSNCRAWDLRLSSADNVIFNRTGVGNADNETFTAGAACPSAVQGDITLQTLGGTEVAADALGDEDSICEFGESCVNATPFLVNAIEIVTDGIGNENYLCESNEACIYTPHFGAYQGEGDPRSSGSCNFSDGVGALAVTGVTMFHYPD